MSNSFWNIHLIISQPIWSETKKFLKRQHFYESVYSLSQKKLDPKTMSNSFWNIRLIVSRLKHDEILPIWSKYVKFHGNRTKILETASLLRKYIEFVFNKTFFLDFAHYGHSALTKLIDARKNIIFLLISTEFTISESFNAILKFWKIRSLQGGEGCPSKGRGAGHSGSSERENFSKFQDRFQTFRYDYSIKMIKKTIFFAHRWACSVLGGHNEQNRGKSLVEKNFDTHS